MKSVKVEAGTTLPPLSVLVIGSKRSGSTGMSTERPDDSEATWGDWDDRSRPPTGGYRIFHKRLGDFHFQVLRYHREHTIHKTVPKFYTCKQKIIPAEMNPQAFFSKHLI